MKRLQLLRHAKSDWGAPNVLDHDRPLNPRGQRVAPMMGEQLVQRGLRVPLIVVSTALRAQQTLAGLGAAAVGDATVVTTRAIYMAEPHEILGALRAADPTDTHAAAMVIGHNPGLEMLAAMLCANRGSEGYHQLTRKYPTAALAVLDFPVDSWRDLRLADGTLQVFLRPRDVDIAVALDD